MVTMVGCFAPASDTDRGFLDSSGYVEEYQQTVSAFPEPMPDGVGFPEQPAPISGEIAKGSGQGQAYFIWSCAWREVYLTSSDPALKPVAMKQLELFPSTEWAVRSWEDPGGIWPNVLVKAELGDPSELAQFYETDCRYYRESKSGAE